VAPYEGKRSINHEIVKRLQHCVDVEKSSLEAAALSEQGKKSAVVTTNYDALLSELKIVQDKLDYMMSEKYSTNLFKMALRYFFDKSEKGRY
jgi:hypothetical protein